MRGVNNNDHFEILFKRVALQDNEIAFKELFHEFYPAMCLFAMRYITDEEIVKDIVQDVFFKIWKNRKRIVITTSFRNFLISSVRNNCTDYLRKLKIENLYKVKSKLSTINISPEDVYTLAELEKIIGEALTKLPIKEREAFEMNRYKGMTYVVIADKMGVSSKTIEAYISHALKILRNELKEYLPVLLLFLNSFFDCYSQ